MADVFISYAHTTSKQAQAAAAALRAAGYSVWLDDELAVHRGFTQAIEEQLTAAKAALVIWSADAARSQWVLSEANRAREDGKLVQLAIDKIRLPMPFDQDIDPPQATRGFGASAKRLRPGGRSRPRSSSRCRRCGGR